MRITSKTAFSRIATALNCSFEQAREISEVIFGRTACTSYPKTEAWINRCYNEPLPYEKKMSAIDEILEGCGVEAIFREGECIEPILSYVNMGDTYVATIVYNHNSKMFHVSSWGECVEKLEAKGIKIH
jgi:hypothetical protein